MRGKGIKQICRSNEKPCQEHGLKKSVHSVLYLPVKTIRPPLELTIKSRPKQVQNAVKFT